MILSVETDIFIGDCIEVYGSVGKVEYIQVEFTSKNDPEIKYFIKDPDFNSGYIGLSISNIDNHWRK